MEVRGVFLVGKNQLPIVCLPDKLHGIDRETDVGLISCKQYLCFVVVVVGDFEAFEFSSVFLIDASVD